MKLKRGAIVGAAIDRYRGGTGVKGAAAGALAAGAFRVLPTLFVTVLLASTAKFALKKGRQLISRPKPVAVRHLEAPRTR